MSYFPIGETESSLGDLGCGGNCACAPCRARSRGASASMGGGSIGEWYERDEDAEPAKVGGLALSPASLSSGSNLNRLTDQLFYRSHPELRGRPLLPAANRRLVAEWLQLKRSLLARSPLPASPANGLAPGGLSMTRTNVDPQGKLATVHPALAARVRQMSAALDRRGVQIRVTSGLRTFAEQDALYAQGRTVPGRIVTQARSGQSNHNYGLAVDIAPVVNGRMDWSVPDATWQIIGEEGRRAGLNWGGDWQGFVDRPHFELPVGLSVQACLKIYQQGGLPAVWAEASRRIAQK